jgi:hypothetical protein
MAGYQEAGLRNVAARRGTFDFWLGGGDVLERVDGSRVDGPAVVRVSRTRTDVTVVRYRDVARGVCHA